MQIYHITKGRILYEYLEFSASIELAETLDSFLSVHHRCHCWTVLQEDKTRWKKLFEGNNYSNSIYSIVCEYVQIYVPSCIRPIIFLGEWVSTYADPRVFEGLFGSNSLGWVNGQHLVDQVLRLWSHCVPLWGRELRKKENGERKCVQQLKGRVINKVKRIGNNTCLLPHVSG